MLGRSLAIRKEVLHIWSGYPNWIHTRLRRTMLNWIYLRIGRIIHTRILWMLILIFWTCLRLRNGTPRACRNKVSIWRLADEFFTFYLALLICCVQNAFLLCLYLTVVLLRWGLKLGKRHWLRRLLKEQIFHMNAICINMFFCKHVSHALLRYPVY